MSICKKCKKNPAAEIIGLCIQCIRGLSDIEQLTHIHSPTRKIFHLPSKPPKSSEGISCKLCTNRCQMGIGDTGFCGIHFNENGKIRHRAPKSSALVSIYQDPLPTNCCAAWFCSGNTKPGNNLAVFFYACNFNCLFCQNSSHKYIQNATILTEDQIVDAALDQQVRCICFFGGSPEPQLPFTIRVAKKIIEQSNNTKHICWEWNGCGNQSLVCKVAESAVKSGGTIKFDLKTYNLNLGKLLCGVDNKQCYINFDLITKQFNHDRMLNATTLLVSYYIDKEEVGEIAKFISERDADIPYSLLVFHPDFYLKDLPITPKQQVEECYKEACKYLNHVNIGNKHLLIYS